VSGRTLILPPPGLAIRRPSLFSEEPLDAGTALGRLFSPALAIERGRRASRRHDPATQALGPFAAALDLLPVRERERASLVAAWATALLATAEEGDRVERRIERLNRTAFELARALAGERVPSTFAQEFAHEAARREMPRRALDRLLSTAREAIEHGRPETPDAWHARALTVSAAVSEAVLGAPPSAATVEAGAAILRLVRLSRLPDDLRRGELHLPSADATRAERLRPAAVEQAIVEECEAIHPLLLRGARSVGEVPLTFRAALGGAIALALRLLGHLEAHPERLRRKPARLGRLETAWTLRNIRKQPLG